MKIKYCRKSEKYVSRQHCEFFNEGVRCEFYSADRWNSMKDLLLDQDRPKWDVGAISKPFKCSLLDRDYFDEQNRRRRSTRRVAGLRI